MINKILFAVFAIFLTSCSNNDNPVPNSSTEIHPLKTGEKIPELLYTAADGRSFNLNNAVKEKPTILIYYRGGWCPFCSKHLMSLQEIEPELLELGYNLIAVSPDKPEKILENISDKKLNYTLISDSKMTEAQKLGIAFKVDEETIKKYKDYEIDLEEAAGQDHNMLPVPAVFIIGTDEVIKFSYVNPDYKVRLDEESLLAAAKSAIK
jgi:peroxiredoxin